MKKVIKTVFAGFFFLSFGLMLTAFLFNWREMAIYGAIASIVTGMVVVVLDDWKQCSFPGMIKEVDWNYFNRPKKTRQQGRRIHMRSYRI